MPAKYATPTASSKIPSLLAINLFLILLPSKCACFDFWGWHDSSPHVNAKIINRHLYYSAFTEIARQKAPDFNRGMNG